MPTPHEERAQKGRASPRSRRHPALLCGHSTFLPFPAGGLPSCWWLLQPSPAQERPAEAGAGLEGERLPPNQFLSQHPKLLAPSSLPHPDASGPPGPHPGGTCLGDTFHPGWLQPMSVPRFATPPRQGPQSIAAQVPMWPSVLCPPPGTQRWHLSTPGGLLLCQVLGGPGLGAKRSPT